MFKMSKSGITGIVIGIVGILLTLLAIWISYIFSESAKLEVTQNLNISDSKNQWLYITIKNIATYTDTGNITVYRLEINPYTPHIILPSLEPGENTTISLRINYSTIPYSKNTLPSYEKLYFAIADVSISYKISCDKCNSQVISRRIPEFSSIEGIITINSNGIQKTSIPNYSWINYHMVDILNSISKNNS
ncbi:Uncharacterised protein [uncultured archaeon]|nr:Uncharacterised protein [uncultured archaeon]